jgi:hypothetical protein
VGVAVADSIPLVGQHVHGMSTWVESHGRDAPDTPRPSALEGASAMEMFFAILILVPTVAVLAVGAAFIVGLLGIDLVGGVDGIVVGFRHRLHTSLRSANTHWGNAALHH